MKKFFRLYTRGFANTYNLVYTETPEEEQKAAAAGYERITRKEAERLCRAEIERGKYNPAFSGYASTEILPIWYPVTECDWRDDRCMVKKRYMVERRSS